MATPARRMSVTPSRLPPCIEPSTDFPTLADCLETLAAEAAAKPPVVRPLPERVDREVLEPSTDFPL